MTTAADLIAVASSQLGYVEDPNNANIFGAWYGANNVAWCAEFQSWVAYTAFHARGEKSPLEGIQNDKGSAYCPFIVTWAKQQGVWREDPQPGRLALFDWDKDGVADHIGLCTSAEAKDGFYDTIEGNTSPVNQSNGGMVMRKRRSNHQGYSLGFVDLGQWFTAPPAVVAAPMAPALSAPGWPGRLLMLTSPMQHGQDVATWQRRMVDRGWKLSVDGWYGRESDTVCRGFQKEKGLVVDGQVGPVTWGLSWTAPVTP